MNPNIPYFQGIKHSKGLLDTHPGRTHLWECSGIPPKYHQNSENDHDICNSLYQTDTIHTMLGVTNLWKINTQKTILGYSMDV